jgi:Taurine catabolism dioxygenase TauD, TfdA family
MPRAYSHLNRLVQRQERVMQLTPDLAAACLVPRRVSSPEEAREVVDAEGAAIVGGIADEEAAIAFGTAMLGADLRRIGRQIEATKKRAVQESAKIDEQPADARGRKRRFDTDTSLPMPAHNDGFAFGDFAPDRLFLFSARPATTGGESFLVDGLALLDILERDPANAEMVEFCRTVDIDHSEPNFPQDTYSPIVRTTPAGRPQVRHHPYLAPIMGPDEAAQWPFVKHWTAAVTAARDTGARFRLEAGDMACVDNYRLFHGRHGYTDPARTLYSIWGWSGAAVAVPEGELDIVTPKPPAQLAG